MLGITELLFQAIKANVFKTEFLKPCKCSRDEKARGESKLIYFSEKLNILSSSEDTLY